MNKISNYLSASSIFRNYFLWFTIGTIVNILIHKGYIISILVPLVIYYLALKKQKKRIYYNWLDVLWIIYFCDNIISWVDNSYAYKAQLVFRFFMGQGAYMFAYWIGRKSNENYLKEIIKKAYIPLLLTALFGIYTYIFKPGWYMSLLYVQFEDSYSGTQDFREFSRLRSIFSSPYVLAYFIPMVLSYYWFKFLGGHFNNNKDFRRSIFLIIVILITAMLCMMRAPFACIALSLVLAFIYNIRYGKMSKLIYKMLVIIILGGSGLAFALTKMSADDYEYLSDKFTSVSKGGDRLLVERATLYKIDETLLGDGAGRHAPYVDNYPPNFQLPDGEYQKELAELGYVGLVLLCLLFYCGFIKGIINFRNTYLELCIISMCLICMFGASCLTVVNEHPLMFWLALGQISNSKIRSKKV